MDQYSISDIFVCRKMKILCLKIIARLSSELLAFKVTAAIHIFIIHSCDNSFFTQINIPFPFNLRSCWIIPLFCWFNTFLSNGTLHPDLDGLIAPVQDWYYSGDLMGCCILPSVQRINTSLNDQQPQINEENNTLLQSNRNTQNSLKSPLN